MNAPFAPIAVCRTLAEVSARIGADAQLIQAAGGNTSSKDGDTLWVKASGLWLRDALTRPMFVPVALGQVRERVAAGEADPVGPALRRELAPEGLRPSIETTLHALMPHAVVLHAHAVDAIAWAMLPDAPDALRMPLAGLRWAWVPYRRPGLPLTQAVVQAMAATRGDGVDVLMMANHGIVVGGASAADAEQGLHEALARLRRPLRAAPPADLAALQALAAGTGWRLPAQPRAHAIATDGRNLARAERGVPYPDHVVFLGHRVSSAPVGADSPSFDRWLRAQRALPKPPAYVALPGRGVLVRDDLGEAAEEMLACLADVLLRLPESPEPVLLPDDEVASLLGWEAEAYRVQLKR